MPWKTDPIEGCESGARRPTKSLSPADWISLNAFYARLSGLTAAKLLRYEWAVALQCENFIKALENSQDPHWISTSLCAVVQYVIYAKPEHYCKKRAKLGSTFEWDEWKNGTPLLNPGHSRG